MQSKLEQGFQHSTHFAACSSLLPPKSPPPRGIMPNNLEAINPREKDVDDAIDRLLNINQILEITNFMVLLISRINTRG
jgi:hypothetical protein